VKVMSIKAGLLTTLLLCALAGASLSAQSPAPVDEFRALSPEQLLADQEQIPAARLVFAAYAIVWLTFALYLFSIWRRVSHVEKELRVVAAKLEGGGR
jgi:CcmD family protein